MRRAIVPNSATLAISDLPPNARAFANLPYSAVTEVARQYHLRSYETWCERRDIPPWPPTLTTLLMHAADCAQAAAFFTVKERIRVVSMVERKRSGVDLYLHSTMQKLLEGIRRENPSAPVSPLRRDQVDKLFSYVPATTAQRNMRCLLLLSYCAGFTLGEHVLLRCEMLRFVETGVWIEGLPRRFSFFIGSAQNPERCPVAALRSLTSGRTVGPVFYSAHNRPRDQGYTYSGTRNMVSSYGRLAKASPLSNDRVRLAGMLEQSRHIDIVRLAHFHGYAHITSFAQLLNRYATRSQRYRYGSR